MKTLARPIPARDRCSASEQPGLAVVPKLKYKHIHFNSFSKMWVDLAAHVSVCIYVYW